MHGYIVKGKLMIELFKNSIYANMILISMGYFPTVCRWLKSDSSEISRLLAVGAFQYDIITIMCGQSVCVRIIFCCHFKFLRQ